jgi:response regulator RpfG family c-di-GMP phosphodiesterase
MSFRGASPTVSAVSLCLAEARSIGNVCIPSGLIPREDAEKIMGIDNSKTQLSIYEILLKKHLVMILCEFAVVTLDILKTVKVDLILLDIEMPNMTGFEFQAEIRSNPSLARIPAR